MNNLLFQCTQDDEIISLINAINSPSKAIVAVAIILVMGAAFCTAIWGFFKCFRG